MKDDLVKEYNAAREAYEKAEKEHMAEIESVLKEARKLENKAMNLAEKYGLSFTLGPGVFVSSKIKAKADELAEKYEDFDASDFVEWLNLDHSITDYYDGEIIEGYWEPSTC